MNVSTSNRSKDNLTPTTVLSENCPKCGQQMFNHPRSITRCARCGHEWVMKEPEAPVTSKERSLYSKPEVLLGDLRGGLCGSTLCRQLRSVAADEIERLTRERQGWVDTAAEFARNMEYYQGLVDRIGRAIGREAYIADDGSVSQDVLRAKVPEIVERVLSERNQSPSETSERPAHPLDGYCPGDGTP